MFVTKFCVTSVAVFETADKINVYDTIITKNQTKRKYENQFLECGSKIGITAC